MIWFLGLEIIFKMAYYSDKTSNIYNMRTKISIVKALRLEAFSKSDEGGGKLEVNFQNPKKQERDKLEGGGVS